MGSLGERAPGKAVGMEGKRRGRESTKQLLLEKDLIGMLCMLIKPFLFIFKTSINLIRA